MESRRRSGSSTFSSRSKRDLLYEEEGCGKDHDKDHGNSKDKGRNCEDLGGGCKMNRNKKEKTNDPRVNNDETVGMSRSTDENCGERDERWEKDLSRRNNFIATDEPKTRCMATEKGQKVESTE